MLEPYPTYLCIKMLITDCIDLANQELSCFCRVSSIAQMRSQNSSSEVSITHSVTDDTATENLELVPGEFWDLLVVCTILRVTECDNRGNLIFHGC